MGTQHGYLARYFAGIKDRSGRMDIKQLKYFVACVQAGAISQAARRLYTTQSAVSKTIKGLEAELGVSLFERLPRGIALTEEGKHIYSYAHKIVNDMDMLEAFPRSGLTKWLRISMNPSCRLADQVVEFYRVNDQKNYHFQIYEADVRTIMERVARRVDDIGFVYVPEEQKRIFSEELEGNKLAFIELRREPMQLYPGKKNVLAKQAGGTVTLEELKGQRLVQNYHEILEGAPIWDGLEISVLTNSDYITNRMLEETDLLNISGGYLHPKEACRYEMCVDGTAGSFLFGCIVYKGTELGSGIKELISFLRKM